LVELAITLSSKGLRSSLFTLATLQIQGKRRMSAILRGVARSDTTPLHARKADNTMMRGEAMAGVEVSRAE
jgi:hypothetical protein